MPHYPYQPIIRLGFCAKKMNFIANNVMLSDLIDMFLSFDEYHNDITFNGEREPDQYELPEYNTRYADLMNKVKEFSNKKFSLSPLLVASIAIKKKLELDTVIRINDFIARSVSLLSEDFQNKSNPDDYGTFSFSFFAIPIRVFADKEYFDKPIHPNEWKISKKLMGKTKQLMVHHQLMGASDVVIFTPKFLSPAQLFSLDPSLISSELHNMSNIAFPYLFKVDVGYPPPYHYSLIRQEFEDGLMATHFNNVEAKSSSLMYMVGMLGHVNGTKYKNKIKGSDDEPYIPKDDKYSVQMLDTLINFATDLSTELNAKENKSSSKQRENIELEAQKIDLLLLARNFSMSIIKSKVLIDSVEDAFNSAMRIPSQLTVNVWQELDEKNQIRKIHASSFIFGNKHAEEEGVVNISMVEAYCGVEDEMMNNLMDHLYELGCTILLNGRPIDKDDDGDID